MRLPLPRRQLWCCVVGSAALLTLVIPSPAAAQARSAAIRVSANVRSITEADLLGADALAAPETPDVPAGAAFTTDAWRITPGRASAVGLQVDGSDDATAGSATSLVTICGADDDGPEGCEPYRAPRVETRAEGEQSTFVVRVGRSRSVVRVTLAFIDF